MRIERHPRLNVWVREDGCIYLPQSGKHHAHWTYGSPLTKGYRYISIKRKSYRVHRLVAETYLPNPNGYETVDHIDRNTSNNSVSNLRWASHRMQRDNSLQVLNARDYGARACDNKKLYCHNYNVEYSSRMKEAGKHYIKCTDGKHHWVKREVA